MATGPPPEVTGLKPCDGPPGTKVTMRGKHLGNDRSDLLAVFIGGCKVTSSVEWKNSTHITARVGSEYGSLPITVLTKSGLKGGGTVTFECKRVTVDLRQESPVWVEEAGKEMLNFVTGGGRSEKQGGEEPPQNLLGIELMSDKGLPSQEELSSVFPNRSTSLMDEKFDPVMFLYENYGTASFPDMKNGYQQLKHHRAMQAQEPVAFVRENLTQLVEIQASVCTFYGRNADDGSIDSINMIPLIEGTNQCHRAGSAVFNKMLERKKRADAQRMAISVLERFSFLFKLPSQLDQYISEENYDEFIRDRVRARSLLPAQSAAIFRQLEKLVDQRVTQLQEILQDKLLVLPSAFEEQQKLISYLVELDCEGDPAWRCMQHMRVWLDHELVHCKDAFLRPPEATSDEETRDTVTFQPDKVGYVNALTQLFTPNFTNYWKLGLAYFKGSLFFKDTGRTTTGMDVAKLSVFKDAEMDLIRLFCNLITAVFSPKSFESFSPEDRERLGLWSSDFETSEFILCVGYVKDSVTQLNKLPELSGSSVEMIDSLADDVRRECMRLMFEQAIVTVKALHTRETWSLEYSDEFGGVTQLPAVFESLVSDLATRLQKVTTHAQAEHDLFSDVFTAKDVKSWGIQLFQGFALSLEMLAFKTPNSDEVVVSSDRMVILLNNCHHTKSKVVPRLIRLFQRNKYPHLAEIEKSALANFDQLNTRLFREFVESSSAPLVSAVEGWMYSQPDWSWSTAPEPRQPSGYVCETLVALAHINADVVAVSPASQYRIITSVFHALLDEILRLFNLVPQWSRHGASQAQLDLIFYRRVLDRYFASAFIGERFDKCERAIPELAEDEVRRFMDLVASLLNPRTPDNLALFVSAF